jgi:hypothetical protein
VAGPKAAKRASAKGLRGNTSAMESSQSGMSSAGTKIPEMKNSGKLMALATAGPAASVAIIRVMAMPLLSTPLSRV